MASRYRVSILVKGILSPARIRKSFDTNETEAFFSEDKTLIRGYLSDISSLTSQVRKIVSSGLRLIEFRCTESDEVE